MGRALPIEPKALKGLLVELDFSVLIIAHGRHGHLQRVLDGIGRSSLRPAEVVVVYMDDPAPPPAACAVPLVTVHIQSHPDDSGLPLARARNTAAQQAGTAHLVFLDVDCIPSAECFTSLLAALSRDAVLAMADPRYLREPLLPGPIPADQELTELSVAHHMRADLPRDTACERHEMFWSLGFAIRTADFARLGGFSTRYSGYGGEDTDFAFTAREQHLPVVFTQGVVYHQHHGVVKPPLNHFDAIVDNAKTFHARWNTWPMTGWLKSFADYGLIDWEGDDRRLEILRRPLDAEIDRARSTEAY